MIFGRVAIDMVPGFWWPVMWLEVNSKLYLAYLELFPPEIWR